MPKVVGIAFAKPNLASLGNSPAKQMVASEGARTAFFGIAGFSSHRHKTVFKVGVLPLTLQTAAQPELTKLS